MKVVVTVDKPPGSNRVMRGMTGVVRGDATHSGSIPVEMDGNFTGHNCDGLIPSFRGYYISNAYLRPLDLRPGSVEEYIQRALS